MAERRSTGNAEQGSDGVAPTQLSELLAILRPAPIGDGHLIGQPSPERRGSTYGGLFIAQSILAAAHTCTPDRAPHSLHASFLRPGVADLPTEYHVETIRDGRGYSHREVRAAQAGRECFRAIVSFQVPKPAGADYSAAAVAPGPDPAQLVSYVDWVREGTDNPAHLWFSDPGPVELRLEDPPPAAVGQRVEGDLRIWHRLRGEVDSDDPPFHTALLAWLTDKTLSDSALLVHGQRWTDEGAGAASLDHTLYLLRPTRADQWFCCTQRVVSTSSGRGLATGEFRTAGGQLVAHAVQEATLNS